MDQRNCIVRGDFELRDPRRPVLFQKSFEGLVEVRAEAAHHQSAAHVRTAGRAAIRDGENRVGLERDVVRVQPGNHFANAVLANFLEGRNSHRGQEADDDDNDHDFDEGEALG